MYLPVDAPFIPGEHELYAAREVNLDILSLLGFPEEVVNRTARVSLELQPQRPPTATLLTRARGRDGNYLRKTSEEWVIERIPGGGLRAVLVNTIDLNPILATM